MSGPGHRPAAWSKVIVTALLTSLTAAVPAANDPPAGPQSPGAGMAMPASANAQTRIGDVAGTKRAPERASGANRISVMARRAETPLTARFEQVPTNHDGETDFTVDLHFSEELSMGYLSLMHDVLAVTGGNVTFLRRLNPPGNRSWELRVTPFGAGPVRIVVPVDRVCGKRGAVCTATNKELSRPAETTVAGPRGLEPPDDANEIAVAVTSETMSAAGNDRPRGLWGDGETLWVADDADRKLYAYALADGSRLPSRDIEGLEAPADGRPIWVWGNGEMLWALFGSADRVQAYRLADGSRNSARDVVLAPAQENPSGLWGDGETLWVADSLARRVFAYRIADGARVPSQEFRLTLGVDSLGVDGLGLWSDGTTFWTATERGLPGVYGYRGGRRLREADHGLNSPNRNQAGLWSDGRTLWMTDYADAAVYGYSLSSASSNATLSLLQLRGHHLGVYSPGVTEYEVRVSPGTTTATLLAAAASGATLATDAADTDAAAAGWQIALPVGETLIGLDVTAADGLTAQRYEVTVTRPSSPPPLTARLSGLPEHHHGGTFVFELLFSEAVEVSGEALRDDVLEVSGGTVTRVHQLSPPGNAGWAVAVDPAGDGGVTVRVPAGRGCGTTGAVCTADGRALSANAEATVTLFPAGRIPNRSYPSNELFARISPDLGDRHMNQPTVIDGYLLLAGNGVHEFWDISDPYSPVRVSELFSPHRFGFVESQQVSYAKFPDGSLRLATPSGRGIDLWDIDNVRQPKLLSALELPNITYSDMVNAIWGIAWQGDYIYLGATLHGLYIVDASDPSQPSLISTIPTSQLGGVEAGALFALGNLLVITTPKLFAGVATFDISDPANPVLLDSVKLPTEGGPGESPYMGMFYRTNAHLLNPFRTYDVTTDPRNIRLLGSKLLPRSGYMTFGDGYLFLGGVRFGTSGIWKYDISDPGNPRLLGRVQGRDHRWDDQYSLPIGNLVVVADDQNVNGHNGGFLAVHDTNPDTQPPVVDYVNPPDGATDQARSSRMALSFSDQIEFATVDSSTLVVRPVGGEALSGKWGYTQTVVTFWPDQPLLPGTSYEIVAAAGGITDLVGNALASEFRSEFQTGGTAPSQLGGIELLAAVATGADAGFVASRTAEGYEFRWDFGDGEQATGASVSHRYDAPGRYTVTLSVAEPNGPALASYSATQIVHRPLTANEPSRSSTVIVTADEARAWAVNPDAGTVTAVDTGTRAKAFESAVGETPRTLAQAPDGTIWVTNEGSHSISVLNSSDGALIATINLPYASMPYGIAFAPDGSAAYVTLQAVGRLLRIDPSTRTIVQDLGLGPDESGIVPKLRGVAISGDSSRILVTRFVSPDQRGEIYDLAVQGQSASLTRTIALAIDPGPDTPLGGRGLPNYISSVTISPDGVEAWVPSKKDNIARGTSRDGQGLTHEHTVRTVVSRIELSSGGEDLAARVDIDDQDMAVALAFSPSGDLLFVAIQGANAVRVLDAYSGSSVASIPTGLAPQGLSLDGQGRLYVQNFLGRSLSVVDVTDLLAGVGGSAQLLAEVDLVASEPLSSEVLKGKRIFYDASSSKMSLEGYMSCASCHLDGGQDGRIWDFSGRGEGLRNTTSLQGRGGTLLHGPVHWTGNFDEIQDFEAVIRSHFGGTGFMSDGDFNSGTRSEPLGDPKAGLSTDLDALAAYVSSLTSVPPSPHRNADGSLTAEGERGKQVFVNERCGSCHSGPAFTDSAPGLLHDVGTIRPTSGNRLGEALAGFDTPTLKGVWATAPYLHDGSASTLAQAIDAHSDVSISESERSALVSFLQQIDELAGTLAAVLPAVSVEAGTAPVTEGTAATYTVTLDPAATVALTVGLTVAESGSVLSGAPPASVAFAEGATSATLTVPTAADAVVEEDSTVTVTVTAGTGYAVGTKASAAVTVEDDDAATFTVSAEPGTIREGESATLTVAVSNGVTFAEAQTITLATAGTASASDYTGVPSTLTLEAGADSVTATLAATADQLEEQAETVAVTASHDGSTIGSATVTINSVSPDATLGALSLAGIDIGTFSGEVTSYQASVANSVTATTVTATASHSGASVSIDPGPEVNLAEGANEIAVTVTAEDGTTTQTYTVMVTRAALPVVSIRAGTTPVTEGTAATFTLTLDPAAPEALTVAVSVTESGSALSGTLPDSVAFAEGATSATLSVPTVADSVVEGASAVTTAVTASADYAVGTEASAAVTVEDDDAATFTVSAEPGTVREGESATLTVAITNGVTFAEAQTITLATAGTASASDYTGVPSTLTLAAGADSVTATLAAAADQLEEPAETVAVTASHDGSTIGSATVTINSVSPDATLAALNLAGIDIGTFSGEVTSYQASVANSVTATTVTATASHSGASVSIDPGPEVNLAEGANQIAVTVTAEDGTTTQTYTVTVTRAALPVVSVVAVEERLVGPIGEFALSRTGPTAEPLEVQVHFTSSRSETGKRVEVLFPAGLSSVRKRVQLGDNRLVEDEILVTWSLQEGAGYAVSAEQAAASLVLEESDVAEFAVLIEPAEIAEGESATLTVRTTNGVRFREAQMIELALSGTAAAADYTGLPATLTLPARTHSVTATLTGAVDAEEEAAETLTVTASHGGEPIGSATATINSVSRDATLGALSLAGIDIGTFSGEVASYQASVANSVTATTVTATASHSGASVSIDPGPEVTLVDGANRIAVTVTAEDGTTTQTYTVTVTRAALPVVSIIAVEERLVGPIGEFALSRTGPTAEPLEVQVHFTSSHSETGKRVTVRFPAGLSSVRKRVQLGDNRIVEDEIAVTWSLQEGAGYAVSAEQAAASLVLEESDVAEFAVSMEPAEIAEGESATLTVRTTNGVRFREAQTIELALSGTAAAPDYTGLPATLTLPARTHSVTATLTGAVDAEEEAAETLTVTASHGGEPIGSATLTINSLSGDATLGALSLSGVDIGTFSGATTSYEAIVGHAVEATTVTATASHSGASVSIDPGSEVSLAEGANRIAVTVTAEDGTTTKSYTVTVTREGAGPPVVSIAALADTVAEGEQARFQVSRTGPTSERLAVQVSVTTSMSSRVRARTMLLEAGSSTSGIGYFRAQDDAVIWDATSITWTIQEGEGYVVSDEAGTATVAVEDNDVAEFALTAAPERVEEGSSATLTVAISNGVRFASSQAIELSAAGGTAGAGTDLRLSAESLTLQGSDPSVTAALEALDDDEAESDETVTLEARRGGELIATCEVVIASRELAAEFAGLPEVHDGETAFGFELRFNKEPAINFETLRDKAFEVTGGSVTGARRLAGESSLRWEITIRPEGAVDVVLTLPVPADCAAEGAVCTAGGSKLSAAVTATVARPQVEPAGFPLARENSRPSGIWSDGQTAWVADLDDARLYAYRQSDGERQPGKDIATGPAPMGLWSDGETLWVAGLGGGLRAHRLADGARQAGRDLALESNAVPAGVWSDGETVWVSAWLGDRVHAYRLADGARVAGRDIELAGENLMPVGVWSDGQTLWVADWRERLYAYRLADGRREPRRDIAAGASDTDPTGLWSAGGMLLATSWEGREVRGYHMPGVDDAVERALDLGDRSAGVPTVGDPALQAAIREALGKAPGEAVGAGELAGLESLNARNSGVRDLAGLAAATGLKELDLGFNPLEDLRPLASLPALESLNVDGSALDLGPLASLTGLRRLSVRHNLVEDLQPLAALAGLAELDIGDNRVEDLRPLAGLIRLEVLRADRNRIAELWPLSGLVRLEVLELGTNRVRELAPLAGLERLRALRVAGNGLSGLHPLAGLAGLADLGLAGNAVADLGALAGLDGLRRLDLRGNAVGDLRPLRGLASLAWVHVGASRIEDLGPLDGLEGLTVAGRDDLEPPVVGGGR